MENGVFKPTTIGTPQGGVISPLLANIVLNQLDWRLEQAGYRFVRYADDFVVVCKTRPAGRSSLDVGRRGHDRSRTLPESREDEDRELREGL